ncbi:MAG: aldo/keto reductase [Thermoanaerobaculia bacterium]
MQRRRLGDSDLEISRIGLGTRAIGGSWRWGWGHQDDADSIRTIHRALDAGVNWIDTAAVYGLGRSESVIAKALRDRRERPYVFTKCGLVWDDAGRVAHRLKRASIEDEVDASLRRLRLDVLDLYQIHWPEPDAAVEEAWETLADLRERGKVRHVGVSNFSVEQLERAARIAGITSLQPPYSMISRDAEDLILPYCQRQGIGVINYSPMASGLLTGAMTRERIRDLPDDDWRKTNREFKEPELTRNLKLADNLRTIAEGRGRTVAEVAVAWTLRHPAVTAAIVGARRPEQVDGVLGGADFEWSAAEIGSLDAALERHQG